MNDTRLAVGPQPADGVALAGERIPSLDGWRAIAIILVLGWHWMFTRSFPPAYGPWIAWMFDGELGVRIFFVISGFLISFLLLRESERTGGINLGRFYLRRIFRIFPIYFTYLAVVALLAACGLCSESEGSWLGCLTFTRNMVGRGQSATIHFWSLAVEEQFYLGWPLLLGVLGLSRRRWLYFAILMVPILVCPAVRLDFISTGLGATFADRILGPRSILVCADSLAVGSLGAWLYWKNPRAFSRPGLRTPLFAVCVIGLVGGHLIQVFSPSRITLAIIPSAQAWAALGCILVGAQRGSPGFGFLNSRPMCTIGILSYSLYVWHFLFVGHFMGERLEGYALYDWRIWLIPSFLCAALSYRYLETPFLRLRRKFRAAKPAPQQDTLAPSR